MGLFKKLILVIIILALYVAGNINGQANEILAQGGNLLVLLLGLIIIYIFFKLIFKAMGCLPSLIVICGIIFFILYTMGALNDGVKEIVPNLQQFFSAGSEKINDKTPILKPQENSISENFNDISIATSNDEDEVVEEIYIEEAPEETDTEKLEEEPIIEKEDHQREVIEKEAPQREVIEKEDIPERKESFFDKIMNYGNNTKKIIEPAKNPYDYPALYGSAKVISGDTLLIRNHVIRLYGIDAPSKKQSCADARGHAYACGKQASRWLQNWILDNEIECHVLKQDKNNNILATCAYGQYDIGAALVMVGWAVPLPNVDVYVPYEQEAQKNHSGMWQGKFYKPWDWENIQAQKPKIKIIKKENKKRLWDYL